MGTLRRSPCRPSTDPKKGPNGEFDFPDRYWRRVTDRYPRGDGTDPGQQPSIGIGTAREALLPPHVRQNKRMRSS